MNYTENYQLCQWEASDPIRREDFNSDNALIDAALGGTPKFSTGGYIGTGTFGEDNPCSLTFEFSPKLILIENNAYAPMLLFQGESIAYLLIDSGEVALQTLSWSADGKTVSWYNKVSAKKQMNESGYSYLYAAWG